MTIPQQDYMDWRLDTTARDWQNKAMQKWEENFRGIVSVVTGGGKTVFAFLCILRFKRAFPEKNIIIIVPTLTLLDQWYIGLKEELNVEEKDIACFSSQEKSKTLKSVNLFLINTARSLLTVLPSPDQYFLIVDECHRAGSEVNSKALQPAYAATLGLSATPGREYDNGFIKYIEPSLGKIIYEYSYTDALADKVISSFALKNVQVNFLPHEEKAYAKISKKLKLLIINYENDKSLAAVIKTCLIQRAKISSSALLRIPITVKLVQEYRRERVIIFHESIDAANEIAEILKQQKFPVALYHSKVSPVIRRNNLQLYKRGIYNILVTCKALDEGMNVPETTIAIISSSTASTRQRIQRLGRVLRPAPGKTKAIIYTIYITDQEKRRLQEEYNTLEGQVEVAWMKADYKNGENSDQ